MQRWKQNPTTWISGVWMLCALMIGSPATANETQGPPALRVSGHAKLSAPPDLARLRVLVVSQNAEAARAAEENAARSRAIIRALESVMGKHGKIVTQGYGVSPQYRYEDGAQILIGYRAQNILRVETEALDRVGDWIDTALEAGADSVAGLEFTLSDDTDLRARALALSAERAQRKAHALAEALNLKLLRIIDVHEEGREIMSPLRQVRAAASFAERSAPPPILPGPVQVEAQVSLVFEVVER